MEEYTTLGGGGLSASSCLAAPHNGPHRPRASPSRVWGSHTSAPRSLGIGCEGKMGEIVQSSEICKPF